MKTSLPKTGYLTWIGSERLCAEELGESAEVSPQLVTVPSDAEQPLVAFARQVIPSFKVASAASVSKLASAVLGHLIEAEDVLSGGWTLHLYPFSSKGSLAGRAELLAEALSEELAKKRRSLKRALSAGPAPTGALVQVVMTRSDEVLISIATAEELKRHRGVLAPHPGGMMPLVADKNPPSRAYLKLREALMRLQTKLQDGESVVDLGAAPGGWTYDALKAGCNVVAVDRSDLRPDLLTNPRLRMVKESAFTFTPDRKVDWLLCDVIAYPHRILALMQRWAEERWAKHFCVSFKFKGTPDLALVEEVKALLEKSADHCFLTQLAHNKNEVMACGHFRTHSSKH